MFDSLEELIKKDEDLVSTAQERLLRYALEALIALALFGGLISSAYFISEHVTPVVKSIFTPL